MRAHFAIAIPLFFYSSFVLSSFEITTYNGNRGDNNSCGNKGKLVTVAQLRENIDEWCKKFGPWQINKADGMDGTYWQVMGVDYHCHLKPGGDVNSNSLCITYESIDEPIFSTIENNNENIIGPYLNTYPEQWKKGFIFQEQYTNSNPRFFMLKTDDEAKGTPFSDHRHWLPITVREWMYQGKGFKGEIFFYENPHIEDGKFEIWQLTRNGSFGYFPTDRISRGEWNFLGLSL